MQIPAIVRAKEMGLCFGVKRAISIVEKARLKYESLETFGPLVHNRLLIEKLAKTGVKAVADVGGLKGKVVVLSTHGVGPQLLQEIQARDIQVVDATCPTVRKAQRVAKKLADAGFFVVIFGETNHPEVKGLLGWAGERAIATLEARSLASVNPSPHRLGVISQTTQSPLAFAQFIKDILTSDFNQIKELHITNTLCQITQKRQQAALELAKQSDLMIVVGGHNSANSQRLLEICSTVVPTYLVEMADELEGHWLEGKRCIGITAGASTPNQTIDEVVSRLKLLVKQS